MIFAEKYKDMKYQIPNREDRKISRFDKLSKEYALSVCEGVYANYLRGTTFYNSFDANRVSRNRSYAYGNQDTTKYKDNFYGRPGQTGSMIGETPESRRKAYANIDMTVVSPMPRIMDRIIGELASATDIVSVDTMDSYSSGLKESMKWGMFVDAKYKDMLGYLKAISGIPQDEQGFIPDNVEELNLYEAEGGFMPEYASVMERLLKYTFELSRFEEDTVDRIIHDLVSIGFATVEDVYDEHTGKVRICYRDPMFTGVQYCKEESYNNPDYAFTVVPVKLSELKRKGVITTDEEAFSLANTFSNKVGNPNNDDWNAANKNSRSKYVNGYDDQIIPTLKVYWIDNETYEEVAHTNKFGTVKTFPRKPDTKIGKMDTVIYTQRKMLYSATWVIGTNMVYDYGYERHQTRDGLADPVIPIHAVKTVGMPIVDRLVPALDQYMMAWLKFQHGVMMAVMNGVSIEIGSISNISLGNKKLDPLELIKIWRHTGVLFRKDKNIIGHVTTTSRPIEPIVGGAGNVIAEAMSLFNSALQMIEETTGISQQALGASPDPNVGKAVTEFSLQGTNTILKNISKPLNVLKSDVARNCCLRLQYVIRDDKKAYKGYSSIIGETELQVLREAEGHDVKYGIRTRVRPTQQDIQSLYESINTSLQNGRDGKVGISEADAVRLRAMISEGQSLKRIAQLLAFANKQAQERAQQASIQNQQMNAQIQQEADQRAAMMAQMASGLKVQEAKETESAKLGHDILLEAYKKGDKTFEEITAILSGVPIEQQMQQSQQQQNTGNPITEQGEMVPQGGAINEPINIPS